MVKDKRIPLYTKIGIRVTIILMIVLSFMLLKNCIGSIHYGTTTSQDEIQPIESDSTMSQSPGNLINQNL